MALPIIEVPSGAIDGINTVFVTSQPYAPGEISVFLNGLLQRKDFDDGWIETNPGAGIVTLKEAPQTTDVVQVYYLPVGGGTSVPDTSVTNIRGVLADTDDVLAGRITTTVLRAVFKPGDVVLVGRLVPQAELEGLLEPEQGLRARIEVCGDG